MYTSNYASVKKLPEGLRPVAISIGLPKWWNGDSDKRLAPSWKMMKSPREVYDRDFKKQLEKLDARQVYDQLGDNAVLLCYETHNDWCHRRMVAEWFEEELGITVPEYGFDREDTFPYAECSKENKGKLYRKHLEAEQFKNEILEEETKFLGEEIQAVKKRKEDERQLTFFDML